jgi:uncharacterized protein
MARKTVCLIFLLLCFVPLGCLSMEPSPDQSKFFALTSLRRSGETTQNADETNALTVGIAPIKIPGYLDREQFVRRISQNRFAIAENDRWAEPLDENFASVLSQDLSILLQTDRIVTFPWERSQQPKYQVQVELLRFEPNAEQIVELWARWSIIDSAKKTITVKESYLSRPTKDSSTEASVVSMSDTVSELSKEIATAIRALIRRQDTAMGAEPK